MICRLRWVKMHIFVWFLGDPAMCHRAWAIPGKSELRGWVSPWSKSSTTGRTGRYWDHTWKAFLAKLGPVTGPNLALLHQLLHSLRWCVTLVSVKSTKDQGGRVKCGCYQMISNASSQQNMRRWQSRIEVWATKNEDVMMSHIINQIMSSKDGDIDLQNIT